MIIFVDMIKVLGKIPKTEFGLACSGGVDSMAILDFLIKGRYLPHVLYFNHNTEHPYHYTRSQIKTSRSLKTV